MRYYTADPDHETAATKDMEIKKNLILAGLLVALIIFRAFLPSIATSYVNKTLSTIPGYRVHIDDVDISLIRGAYVVENIRLEKTSGKVPVPFFSAQKLDLSLEWSALLNASLVDPDADILATLGGLIKNAFIHTLQPCIEGSITFQKARAQ